MMRATGPQPSMAEALLAEYGEHWEIWRELRDGTHRDWIARRWQHPHDELHAATIEGLAEQLEGETMTTPHCPNEGAS